MELIALLADMPTPRPVSAVQPIATSLWAFFAHNTVLSVSSSVSSSGNTLDKQQHTKTVHRANLPHPSCAGCLADLLCWTLLPHTVDDTDLPDLPFQRARTYIRTDDGYLYAFSRLMGPPAPASFSLLRSDKPIVGIFPDADTIDRLAWQQCAQGAADVERWAFTLGLPSAGIWRNLFLSSPRELPSKRVGIDGQASISGAVVLQYKRLDEISQALSQQRRATQIDQRIGVLTQQQFTLQTQLKQLHTQGRAVYDAQLALDRFSHLEKLPEDAPTRIKQFQSQQRALDQDLERWNIEEKKLLAQSNYGDDVGTGGSADVDFDKERIAPTASFILRRQLWQQLSKNNIFVAALAVGVLSTAIAIIAGSTWPTARWLSICNIPAFAVALWSTLRELRRVDLSLLALNNLRQLRGLRDQRLRRFELERGEMARLLGAGSKFENADAMVQQFRDRTTAQQNLDTLTAALQTLGGPQAIVDTETALNRTVQEMQALEDELRHLQDVTVDSYGLGEEAKSIRASLQQSTPEMVAALAVDQSEFLRLLRLVQGILLADESSVLQVLLPTFQQAATSICSSLFASDIIAVHLQYGLPFVQLRSGSSISWAAMTYRDKDRLWFAYKVSLASLCLDKINVPLILDLPIDGGMLDFVRRSALPIQVVVTA